MSHQTWGCTATYQSDDNTICSEYARSEFNELPLAEKSILNNAVAMVSLHGHVGAATSHLDSIERWDNCMRQRAVNALVGEVSDLSVEEALQQLVGDAPLVRSIRNYALSTTLTHTRRLLLNLVSGDNGESEHWEVRHMATGWPKGTAMLMLRDSQHPSVSFKEGHELASTEVAAVTKCLEIRKNLLNMDLCSAHIAKPTAGDSHANQAIYCSSQNSMRGCRKSVGLLAEKD